MEVAVAFWIICAIVSGLIASARGLNGCGYTILGFVLGPFGVLMACVIPSPKTANVVYVQPSQGYGQPSLPSSMPMRTCPECLSDIPAEAKVCRYCQRSSEPRSMPDTRGCTYERAHQWVWFPQEDCWRCSLCYMYRD